MARKRDNQKKKSRNRNERRDLSKGERAIGHGMLYSDPDKGGRGNKKKGGETPGLARFVCEAHRGLNSVLPNIIRCGVVFFKASHQFRHRGG
jgi:hypothetical protein